MKKFVTPQKQPAGYYKMILPVSSIPPDYTPNREKQIKYLKLIVPNCIFCYIYGVVVSILKCDAYEKVFIQRIFFDCYLLVGLH